MSYKIMIAIGKPGYLYEIWGTRGNGQSAEDHTHHGYFNDRSEAEKALAKLAAEVS